LDDLLKKRIAERDEKHLDPSERAELVNSFIFLALALEDPHDVIKQPLYWDFLSYAVELLNIYAQELAIAGEPEVLQIMRLLNKYMKSLHYSLPDDSPELGPAREEHEALWTKRIEDYV
jgi:hypothetical protein